MEVSDSAVKDRRSITRSAGAMVQLVISVLGPGSGFDRLMRISLRTLWNIEMLG